MGMQQFIAGIEQRIEGASALDKPAAALSSALSKVIKPGPVQDALGGTALAHPVHPALVAVPMGAWTSALALDLAGDDAGAQRLIGFGCLAALPATTTGASDWMSLHEAEQRVGFVHALANYAAIGSYALSWMLRRGGHRGAGIGASVAGAALVTAAGWLGGHLAYAQGVGVDTTAFQTFPEDWTDAGAVDDLPASGQLGEVEVDGVPLLVTAQGSGWTVMADRCTHRGAPLHEGEIENGCVVCPWHDSEFSLQDGTVRRGPATRPQPMLESRVQDGRLQVRKAEERALRANTIGS